MTELGETASGNGQASQATNQRSDSRRMPLTMFRFADGMSAPLSAALPLQKPSRQRLAKRSSGSSTRGSTTAALRRSFSVPVTTRRASLVAICGLRLTWSSLDTSTVRIACISS
jgi:hypothetical protein